MTPAEDWPAIPGDADRRLAKCVNLADTSFTESEHNAVLVGEPSTGKTHLCTALGVAGITRHGKRVRFCSTLDLVNALEREKAEGQAGRIALNLMRMDLGILDKPARPAGRCCSTC